MTATTTTLETHPSWCEQDYCSGLDHHAEGTYVRTVAGDLGDAPRVAALGVAPAGTDHGTGVVNVYVSDVAVDDLGAGDLLTARLTPCSARLLAASLVRAAALAESN